MGTAMMPLHVYLDKARTRPFSWGAHDCLHFALGAVTAQTGRTFDIPTYHDARKAACIAARRDLCAEMDALFARCPHVPPPGSLVAVKANDIFGRRLGVVVSDKAAFVSPEGLVFDRLAPDIDIYWVVK